MTKILRNALLAAVAVSGLAGSAMAAQDMAQTGCEKTPTNELWAGRCCGAGNSDCMGGGHEHQHGDRDGRKR